MITVEEWAEIRRLHVAEGLSQRAIADRLGLARKTVARALASQGPPSYSRPPAGAVFDAFEGRVSGVVVGVPLDAGVGDRGAGRLGWVGVGFHTRVAVLRPEHRRDPPTRPKNRHAAGGRASTPVEGGSCLESMG